MIIVLATFPNLIKSLFSCERIDCNGLNDLSRWYSWYNQKINPKFKHIRPKNGKFRTFSDYEIQKNVYAVLHIIVRGVKISLTPSSGRLFDISTIFNENMISFPLRIHIPNSDIFYRMEASSTSPRRQQNINSETTTPTTEREEPMQISEPSSSKDISSPPPERQESKMEVTPIVKTPQQAVSVSAINWKQVSSFSTAKPVFYILTRICL